MIAEAAMSFAAEGEAPPAHHLTDWGGWTWALALTVTLVLLALSVAVLYLFLTTPQPTQDAPVWPWIAWLTLSVACGATGFWIYSEVARHIATPTAVRWWLAMPLLAVGAYAFLASRVRDSTRWAGWTMAGCGLFMQLIVTVTEALTRIAANIPIALSVLVTAIIGGVVILIAYSASANRPSAAANRRWTG